jgi:hypothetical protein
VLRPRLASAGYGEHYRPIEGHRAGLNQPVTTWGMVNRRDRTPVRPNWLRPGKNKVNQARERVPQLRTELRTAWRDF